MERTKKLLNFISISLLITSCQLSEKYAAEQVTITENFSEQKTCIIGDTGTGSSDQELVAKALATENCHNVIHTGDIIYPNGLYSDDSPEYLQKFKTPFSTILESSRVFLTLGNHDHKRDPLVWKSAASKNESLIFPGLFYSVVFNDACLFFIDTTLNYRKGQEGWLKSQIETLNGNCKTKIAIGHHPYRSSGHHGDAPGMINKFLKNHIIGKVDYYFSGHDHQLSIERPQQNTALLISGAGAKVRPIKMQDKAIYAISDLGYITMSFSEKGISFEVKRVDENGIAHSSYTYSKGTKD